MTNEFNKPVKMYNGDETYREVICFNYDKKTDEFANSTDLFVTAESIEFDTEDLTDEQISEVQTLAEGIQAEIRHADQHHRMIQQTNSYLMYN